MCVETRVNVERGSSRVGQAEKRCRSGMRKARLRQCWLDCIQQTYSPEYAGWAESTRQQAVLAIIFKDDRFGAGLSWYTVTRECNDVTKALLYHKKVAQEMKGGS